MKKMISNFGGIVLSREQMKGVKGGDDESLCDGRSMGCVCYATGIITQMCIGPDDSVDAAVAFLCGSSTAGCCNCCY